jgi:Lon protease-like protein
MEIPLFPLHTVLYPEGPLPLRVFEQRYLDMVSRCVKDEAPFGVLLIRHGSETGPAHTYNVGTLARITDWYQGSDGLLGITATGGERFRLVSSRRQANGLAIGEVELLPAECARALPDNFLPLARILSGVLDDLGKLYEPLEKRYDDAVWVGYRFSEILPITPEQKQACLETDDPITRLEIVSAVLNSVRG